MTEETRISVVIPCYNGAAFLPETLTSVLGQTYAAYEVIVIDDGSDDDSASMAASFGPLVRVVRQANQGESVARNRGIDEARGNWIAFLDADDIWEPTKLERQVSAVKPGFVAMGTQYYRFGEGQTSTTSFGEAKDAVYTRRQIAVTFPTHLSSLIVRSGLSARFPTWTQFGEDLIYCLDLMFLGKIGLVREPLTGYRIHAQNQSNDPAIHVRRHQAIEKWLAQQAENLEEEEVRDIEAGWYERLNRTGVAAYWDRNWALYWAIRRHLLGRRAHASLDPIMTKRLFPRWCYAIKDWWDRVGLFQLSRSPTH
jgi:glycosyltransferase involved in cell wall biosynthesis